MKSSVAELMARFEVPAGNRHFQYSPLATRDTIRLLHFSAQNTTQSVHLELQHHSDYHNIANAIKYVALSYCWGDPVFSEKIYINRKPFFVTENLLAALHAIQAHGPDKDYWIDAICVNQHDVNERSTQVQQMWRIFSSAEYVISWLGEGLQQQRQRRRQDHQEISAVITQLRDFEQGNMLAEHSKDEQNRVIKPLAPLLANPYFQRTWIISEILHAKDITVLWGAHTFPWQNFVDLSVFCWDGLISLDPHIHQLFFARVKMQSFAEASFPEALYRSLSFYSKSSCTDARDKIFAMLSNPYLLRWEGKIALRADYNMTKLNLAVAVMHQWLSLSVSTEGLAEWLSLDRILFFLDEMLQTSRLLKFRTWLQLEVAKVKWTYDQLGRPELNIRFTGPDEQRFHIVDTGFVKHFLKLTASNLAEFQAAGEQWWRSPDLQFDWPRRWPEIPFED